MFLNFYSLPEFRNIFMHQMLPYFHSPQDVLNLTSTCRFFVDQRENTFFARRCAVAKMLRGRLSLVEFSEYEDNLRAIPQDTKAIKAYVIGNGNTDLIKNYIEYVPLTNNTIGLEFWCKHIDVGAKGLSVFLHDEAGQRETETHMLRFEKNNIVRRGYADTSIIYVVCDANTKDPYNNFRLRINEARELTDSNTATYILLLRNYNLSNEIDGRDMEKFIDFYGIDAWFPVDSSDNTLCKTAFDMGVKFHLQKHYPILLPTIKQDEVVEMKPPQSRCVLA